MGIDLPYVTKGLSCLFKYNFIVVVVVVVVVIFRAP